jgi:acid stress chaperone HdeB
MRQSLIQRNVLLLDLVERDDLRMSAKSAKPTEVIVKPRLLLTGAVFLFAQIPTMQAQETLDLAKITCRQFVREQLAAPSRDITLLLAGYYNGKRNNTIIEPQKIKKEDQEVNSYCFQHSEATVMDAVKNVLGFDK